MGLTRIAFALLLCAGCKPAVESSGAIDAGKIGPDEGGVVDASPVVDASRRADASSNADAAADASADGAPTPEGGATDGGAAAFAWSTLAPLPLPRTSHGVAAVAGKVYAFGGYSGSMLARVDAYDPASDTWTQMADMPEARRAFASGVIGGKIYVAGGANYTDGSGATFLTSTRVYDPATDTWTSLAPCPLGTPPNDAYGNLYVGGAVFGNLFYVFEALDSTTTVLVYDPQTDTWTMNSGGGYGFSETTGAAIGNVLYVFATDEYPPEWAGNLFAWYSSANAWVVSNGLGQNAMRSAVFTMNGLLYSAGGVAGGINTYQVTGAVWAYDPATEAWTQRGALGVPREYAGAAVLDGKVYVVGGDVPTSGQPSVPSAVVEVGVPQ